LIDLGILFKTYFKSYIMPGVDQFFNYS